MREAQKYNKQRAYQKGLWAETLAAGYMRLKGYKLLETRYKTRVGEVDLIFVKDGMLVFTEVKARNDEAEGLEAVNYKSRRRIEQAALHYIAAQAPEYDDYAMRFDVLVVGQKLGAISFHHLDNAWQAGE
ncbi:MAG: YraN family protein [Alphaproteobacteria bacterium]|nr:YraN family protein [Alphaproteobacteria bacterium]